MAEVGINKISIKQSDQGKVASIWLSTGEIYFAACSALLMDACQQWQAGNYPAKDLIALFTVNDDTPTVETRKLKVQLERLSEHISTDGIHVYYDNAQMGKIALDSALEEHLVKLIVNRSILASEEADAELKAWCAFAENLYSNVDPEIRGQIVRWLISQNWLTLTEDGCLIGYKGCQINEEHGYAESVRTGPGVVNGELVNGHIPNRDGDVVEIDRTLVVANPSVGCAMGMHVGTYKYARNWANGILCRVKLDPRDIISVPFDCDAQKVRCCRYLVLDHEEIDATGNDTRFYDPNCLTWLDNDNDDDDDEDEEDDWYRDEDYEPYWMDDKDEEEEEEDEEECDEDVDDDYTGWTNANTYCPNVVNAPKPPVVAPAPKPKPVQTFNGFYDSCIRKCSICPYARTKADGDNALCSKIGYYN